MRLRTHARDQELRSAVAWYREHGRPVDVVIPSYRDAERVRALVRSIRKTVAAGDGARDRQRRLQRPRAPRRAARDRRDRRAGRVRAQQRLRRQRQPRPARERCRERDVVVLNSDVEALPGWLECLQYAARTATATWASSARSCSTRTGASSSAAPCATATAPEWFDHRYRFKPSDWGPAGRPSPALAVTGACMYVRREVIERVGLLDERYAMAYEDVDWCLRAWQAGFGVLLLPGRAARPPRVRHPRHRPGRARARRPSASSGSAGRTFFDAREVGVAPAATPPRRGPPGRATPDPARARDRAPADRLRHRGHRRRRRAPRHLRAPQPARRPRPRGLAVHARPRRPTGSPCARPCTASPTTTSSPRALAELDAIKVATWWMTAAPVFRASVVRGLPVYFVQDIETSYYPDHEHARHAVLDSYRPEFRYMTISAWNRERLRELGLDAELIPPGIDLDTFRPRPEVARREDMVLALGRANPLKNLPLTLAAWQALERPRRDAPRPELCLFGIEPELARDGASRGRRRALRRVTQRRAGRRAVRRGDRVRADLRARGLRAAPAGGDGHRRRRGLHRRARQPRLLRRRRQLPDARAHPRRGQRARSRGCSAIPSCARGSGGAGIETAREYAWERRIDALEAFFGRVAASRRMALGGELA